MAIDIYNTPGLSNSTVITMGTDSRFAGFTARADMCMTSKGKKHTIPGAKAKAIIAKEPVTAEDAVVEAPKKKTRKKAVKTVLDTPVVAEAPVQAEETQAHEAEA